MKEITDIIKAYDTALKAGKRTALATVVLVEGSSYRRPGARMLVTDDGALTGAISGGCLEGDALRKALAAIQQQKPALVTYDTSDEDDAKLGVQLGCNGIVHILFEPINHLDSHNAIELLKALAGKRQHAVLATLFDVHNKKAAHAGTCMLLTQHGIYANENLQKQSRFAVNDMHEALQKKSSAIKQYEQTTALIDFVAPAVALLIFGGGNDAMPLVKMADILGWQATVIDGRSNYATAARFPLAHQLLMAKPHDAFLTLEFDSTTAVVLMTHNYNYDIAMLQLLLPLQLPYVGVLGPRSKLQRMLDELQERGMNITSEQLQSIYGPTGLDIGAETAEEIALSIAAEIKTVMTGRTGIQLRSKDKTIHAEA